MVDLELRHHGILGQKWGIRRYQNKDGSLTAAGKNRLSGYNEYVSKHKDDFTIKRNTVANRVIGGLDSEFKNDSDPRFKGLYEKSIKDAKEREKQLDTKYVSVDNVRNSGRDKGLPYYMYWFSDDGFDPDKMYVDTYEFKKDIRVASGEKVINEIIKEVGKEKLSDTTSLKSITLDYTEDKNIFSKVNESMKKQGYDAIEDVNDPITDMPIIVLNAKTSMALKETKSGEKAIDDYFKNHKEDSL